MPVRGFRQEDASHVRRICLATGPEALAAKPELSSLLLTAFCEYYIRHEPENCFVAVNEHDEAVGYVLCAENAAKWNATFREEYIQKAPEGMPRFFLEGSCRAPMQYAAEYPAHLHIDIDPACHRRGLGTQLLDALTSSLRAKGIPGLMFSVAKENVGAQSFYAKYGFAVLEEDSNEIVMGMKL